MVARQVVLSKRNGLAFLFIALSLSSFTHLFNPAGFPDLFYDEGVYMRRAMHVLAGLGPQEGNFYDHPYFGQLFLAGFLGAIGYPDSLNPTETAQSVAELYTVPRVLMGILSVADTFLVFKIAERRYGPKVALVAGILFAVMPITWLTRRILLDSILLPFFLASVLFALYSSGASGRKKLAWIGLSGAFLGLAIFTKMPAFTMIPLVAYVLSSGQPRKARARTIALWLIPVVAIPLIWPVSAISGGHFNDWLSGALWQTQRQSQGISSIITSFFQYDPVMLVLAFVSVGLAAIQRDFFVILWAGPFLVFLSLIGYVQYFYWIPVIPIFCIAGGRLIDKICRLRPRAFYPIAASFGVFGLVSVSLLITTQVTKSQYEAAAFAAKYSDEQTTMAASPTYAWLFLYVFKIKHSFTDYRDLLYYPVETKKLILIVDEHFRYNINAGQQLGNAYNNTKTIATFTGENYDAGVYPYTSMRANHEGAVIQVRKS